MLIKKLAVPFVNEKLLMQAEHCTFATSGISEAAFDFVRTRLPLKCKIDIVTGLDTLTSPNVLKRIWRNYQDRISLHIYTKNFFHPNAYIFDLPYRKAVAYVGSGSFTMGGLKDNEEIFWKVLDTKDIENLKSWFIGYYEFSTPLSEEIILEYESIYHDLRRREIASHKEKQQFIALTASGFSFESIKFKNQYFKKEDYLVLSNTNASLHTAAIVAERKRVKDKLLQLHEGIQKSTDKLKIHIEPEISEADKTDVAKDQVKKIRSLSLQYRRVEVKQNESNTNAQHDSFYLQLSMLPKDLQVGLSSELKSGINPEREYFKTKMSDESYRQSFFASLPSLGIGYTIEVAGETRALESFQNPEALWEFTKMDEGMRYTLSIYKNFYPGDAQLSNDNIGTTITKEFEKLIVLYNLLQPEQEKPSSPAFVAGI